MISKAVTHQAITLFPGIGSSFCVVSGTVAAPLNEIKDKGMQITKLNAHSRTLKELEDH